MCRGVFGEKVRRLHAVAIRGIQKSTTEKCLQKCKRLFPLCITGNPKRWRESEQRERKEILPWPDPAEARGFPSNRGINLLSLAPKSFRSRSDGIVFTGQEMQAGVGSPVTQPLEIAQKPQKCRLWC